MKAIVCDICGNIVCGGRTMTVNTEGIDLCPICEAEFKKWMKAKKDSVKPSNQRRMYRTPGEEIFDGTAKDLDDMLKRCFERK